MENNLSIQPYEQMTAETEQRILKSPESWSDFLRFAARFYKYSYYEQLQIYAQRPEATACADMDTWNLRMGRRVTKEENGIGIISEDLCGGKLRYIFDVSDTEGKPFPPVWALLPEQEKPVIDFIRDYFDVAGDTTEEAISNAAEIILQESLDIFAGADYNSFEELKRNREFLKKSIASIALLRCGKKALAIPQEILPQGDEPETVSMIGRQINEASRVLLRQIEKTVKAIDRERSEQHEHNGLQGSKAQREERAGLREERGLLDSGDHDPGTRDGTGSEPLGTGSHEFPEGAAPVGVRISADPREAVLPLSGDGAAGRGTVRDADEKTGKGSRSNGEPESQRPDEMGGLDEQLQSAGGGDHLQRNDLRLTEFSMDGDQLSLFPTEEKQSEIIKGKELDVKTPGSFSVSAVEFDNILRRGGLSGNSAQRIYQEISAGLSLPEIVSFLKKEYGTGGYSYTFANNKTGFVGFSAKGISVSDMVNEKVLFPWTTVAKRLRNLVAEEKYLLPEADKKTSEDTAASLLPEGELVPNSWSVHEAHNAYLTLKKEHPDDLILVQVGDFFELYQDDAKAAAEILNLTMLRTAELEGIGRVPMTGFPSHALEEYTEKLRAKQGVTIIAYDRESRSMKSLSFSSFTEKEAPERDYSFEYQLLDRLRSDCEYFLGAGSRHEKCLWAGTVSEQIAKMRELYNLLPEKPEWLTEEKIDSYAQQMKPQYQVVVYHHFENGFDERLEYQTPQEAEKVAQSYVDGTMEESWVDPDPDDGFKYDGAGVYDLQEKRWVHVIGDFPIESSLEEKREKQQHTETEALPKISMKLEPPYKVGNTVYLDDTVFLIDEIRDREVSLRDPKLDFPIFRVESKEKFERLLRHDERNSKITDFLFADLFMADGDFREVLTAENGLLSAEEKETINSWFRAGDGNAQIAQRLSEIVSDRAERMELITGEMTDYFTSPSGLEINVLDDNLNGKAALYFQWSDIAAFLRTIYLTEQQIPTKTEYAASVENAPAMPQETSVKPSVRSETVAVYTAEQYNTPYNIVVEELHSSEPEQEQTSEENRFVCTNYHIADDDLGTGTFSQKYTRNAVAVRMLKALEKAERMPTPVEQEVLARYVGWGGLADAFDERNSRYQETKDLFTESEYVSARASTLNAHYTTPVVIRAIYAALENMGFHTGKILEPACGVGNFFGCMPESMWGSDLYGVELDSITGRIAQKLYPTANITVAGFETTDFKDFFDVAVGNVPFGQYSVNDPAYNKLGFSIHDYFFAKALDQVRPGGIIAFISSRYTLDKQSSKVRKYIAQRAEMLGAIRLPNNAFKSNAGTEVVSDIIFLQKRERPIEIEPEWVHLGQTADGFPINSYFIDHPEMMLGIPGSESTQYARQDFTLIPIPGADLEEQLREAIRHISGTYREAVANLPPTGQKVESAESIPADPDVRRYSYTVVDGTIYYREDARMERIDTSKTAAERIKGMIALRDTARALIAAQMENAPDEPIQALQTELNRQYDDFYDKFGRLNDRVNARAFEKDDSYYLLCSLEILDGEGKFKRKSDMFTRRTIKPHTAVASVDTAAEALAVSISEKAHVDLGYMASLMGGSEKIPQIVKDLQGVIFKDPSTGSFDLEQSGTHWAQGWQTADEYLSGNIRKKLEIAKAAAEKDPFFAPYVETLQAVLPNDLDASEISVTLGAAWIDPEYVQQFMYETFQTPIYQRVSIKVEHSAHTAEWHISGKSISSITEVLVYSTYGTKRASAYEILENSLNLRDTEIYDRKMVDGKEKRVLNGEETVLAQQKQQAVKDAFQDWLWKDPERRRTLVRKYNDTFNSTRPREYDGSHLAFHGMNPEITLKEHQLNAVAHILYGENVLLAHKVGAGKTFEMIAAAMESKRLGLCHKPLFVVPNHIIGQWASEFYRLYPTANVLVTMEKDFEKANRKKFCARIATGDYDAVIMGHSQFERIPISPERQANLIRDQITNIEAGISELEETGGEHYSVKQLEKTKKSLQTRLEKLQEAPERDDVVSFEELGVDRLFVDEAHSFKNLFFYTKMSNVAGLSTAEAQKSSDMLAKCRYIDETTGGKGIVFATGTPLSNSMVEIYTMQRYLQWDTLERYGWSHFDCWAAQFGETQTAIELAPEGTGYRARKRFARFKNLPELMNVFREVADIKTEEDLQLPTPEVEFQTIVAQPTAHQKFLMQELSKRAAAIHNHSVDPTEDNMLKVTSDGRKLGLDQRLINPDFPDDSGSKVNQCVNYLFQIWQRTAEKRLTQLVFCDFSTPKDDGSFNLYDDIRDKLLARGVPAEEIAYIHSAKTTAQKKELFAKVRTGKVRILMGSTQKMGAGTDVQDRLIALHDLDCPWKAGDLEQRLGRIERQGNQNSKVCVLRYVTDSTFDSYLWQTVEIKQRFTSQIMTSKTPLRVYEDNDATALSYAEIKALCAGNPLIKEKMDLDISVSKLKLLKADFEKVRHGMEDDLCINVPQRIAQYEQSVKNYQEDLHILAEHPLPAEGFIGMEISGKFYTEKEDAGAAILSCCKSATLLTEAQIGSYRGFDCFLKVEGFGQEYILILRCHASYRVELGESATGNISRIENALNKIQELISATQERLEAERHQLDLLKEESVKPFPQEDELREKNTRLIELTAQLSIDEKERQNTAPEQCIQE